MTTIRRNQAEFLPLWVPLRPWWGARCDIYWPFVVRKWPPGVIWQEPTPSTLPWSIDQNMSTPAPSLIRINYISWGLTLGFLHQIFPSLMSVLIVVVTVNNLIIKWSRPAPGARVVPVSCHHHDVRPRALAWPPLPDLIITIRANLRSKASNWITISLSHTRQQAAIKIGSQHSSNGHLYKEVDDVILIPILHVWSSVNLGSDILLGQF